MKTVLITGISKGIGQALARKFIKEGFEVVGTVYTGTLPYLGMEISGKLLVFNLDLSSSQSIAECTNEIVAVGKKIDILINNAGALFDEEETSVVVEKLRKTLEVNLIGPIDFTEKLIPLINPGGHIINMSSTAGSIEKAELSLSHYPHHYPSYKISKAGLNMYTATLSLRLKDSNITVSSVHPGWVRTDIGGPEADIEPEEAAEKIFDIAISKPETGGFWFGKERLPW